jgi:biotin operon repressor
MNKKNNHWVLIPPIIYSSDLPDKAKILHGRIMALSDKEGYCYATNGFFAEELCITKQTVSQYISRLRDEGFVTVQILYQADGKTVKTRYLTPLLSKTLIGIKQNPKDSIREKFSVINNTKGATHQKGEDLLGKKLPIRGNKKTFGDMKTSIILREFRKIWGEPTDKKINWEASNISRVIDGYTQKNNTDFTLTARKLFSEISQEEWGFRVKSLSTVRRHTKKLIEDKKAGRSSDGYRPL